MTIADQLVDINNSKQAIKTAIEAKGVTVGSAPFSQYATKIGEITGGGGTPEWSQSYYDQVFAEGPGAWVRNRHWLELPSMTSSDQAFYGLVAIFPTDGNFFAFSCAGAYTVDWGDGTSQNFTSGSRADKLYDYNNSALAGTDRPVTFTASTSTVNRTAHGYSNGETVIFYNIVTTTGISSHTTYYVINATADTFQISLTSGGAAITLTNDGSATLLPYKQAVVSVTPQAGQNLTALVLNEKHGQSLLQSYTQPLLDIILGSPNFASIGLNVSASGSPIRLGLTERVRILNLGNNQSLSYEFNIMDKLQVVELPDTSLVTNFSFMFIECESLVTVPLFDTSNSTTFQSMFASCRNLKTVPNFQFKQSGTINCANMFGTCSNLQFVPEFNSGYVTDMNNMFSNCVNLESVPLLDTQRVTNMQAMFNSCFSIKQLPAFNTAQVTNMISICSNCYSLETIADWNTPLVTSFFSAFSNCNSLLAAPALDTSAATNLSNMYNSCVSMTSVPYINAQSATNTTSMFQNCYSLERAPDINFNTTTTFTANTMFSGCFILKSIPNYNLQNASRTDSMFATCKLLTTIPKLNLSSSTNCNSMFSTCRQLTEIPDISFNTVSSSSNFSSIFANCNNLARIRSTGHRFTFSVASCKLSGAALDEIYTNLPTATGQTITVSSNYGTATDNPSIATAKGWTVTGS
jgi:hypothetical protein